VAAALTDGYHLAFWIACGLVIVAAGLAGAVLRPQPSLQPAARPAPGRRNHLARTASQVS
jgi:hypothetical protein